MVPACPLYRGSTVYIYTQIQNHNSCMYIHINVAMQLLCVLDTEINIIIATN